MNQNSLSQALGENMHEPHDWFAKARRPVHVEQRLYQTSQVFQRLPPIDFRQGRDRGIPLSRVLDCTHQLPTSWNVSWTDASKEEVGQKISLRVNWVGYQDRAKQINVRHETHAGDAIPLSRLVKKLAESIRDIIEGLSVTTPSDKRFELANASNNGIRFEDLELIRLDRVGKGSWQPTLIYVPHQQSRR
ncbi:hypothetical protein PHLGIDRAFT_33717 [Phlebiopsis gigantea 11061_1 CR5-6]|uniref:Uncharacterized protein n=1 Tax=Phlebiopsis gigantea (strain 11061_1 CR5-6) TaxID=745531 RepID=A0A0C3SES0_PHLG1|nr:hypothetical protein PHLGIDRAFT_33717 [Phlebiopsis gigantea 11061_1 CR5-6]